MTAIVPLEAILATIPTLDSEAIKKIHSRIKLRLSGALEGAPKPSPSTVVEFDYLLEGACTELKRRRLFKGKRLPSHMIPNKFARASASMRGYLERRIGEDLSSTERVALGRLAMSSLADYLENGGIPISARTLLLNVDKVVYSIDAAFPGYLKAGLLRRCWNS